MTVISDAEMGNLRGYFQDAAMVDTLAILERVETEDDLGGQSYTYASVGTVPCLIYPGGTRPLETGQGDQTVSRADWEALLPVGTRALATDRLQISSGRPDMDGRTFEVVADLGGEPFAVARRLALSEVV